MKLNLFGPNKIGKVLILDGDNVIGFRIVNLLLKEGEFPGVDLRVGFREMPAPDEVAEGWEYVEKIKFVWEDETTYADALYVISTFWIFCNI
jgi:hypothetical protein